MADRYRVDAGGKIDGLWDWIKLWCPDGVHRTLYVQHVKGTIPLPCCNLPTSRGPCIMPANHKQADLMCLSHIDPMERIVHVQDRHPYIDREIEDWLDGEIRSSQEA